MALLSSIKKPIYLILTTGLTVVVALNLYQLQAISDNQPNNYSFFHRYSTDDFEAIYGNKYRTGRITYGLYITLGDIAPNLKLYIDSEVSPKNTKNISAFDDFHNRLEGSASADVVYTAFEELSVLSDGALQSSTTQVSGETWPLASRQRKGGQPLEWKIYADSNEETNEFVLFRTGPQQINFVDLALLKDALRLEIMQ